MTITVGYAQSLDGKLATATGDARWISGHATLCLAHELRAGHEAILVGVGTVLRDDPQLTCRLPDPAHSPPDLARSPLRVVLDSTLRTPPSARLLRSAGSGGVPGVVLLTTARAEAWRRTALEQCGAEVVQVAADRDGRVAVDAACAALAARGIDSLYVEGGAAVVTAFLAAQVVQRLVLVVAPLIIGAGGIAAVWPNGGMAGSGNPAAGAALPTAPAQRLSVSSLRQLGGDLVWELRLGPPA